jgi:hypothetical protein
MESLRQPRTSLSCSKIAVSKPQRALSPAIPRPIVPPPTTRTRRACISGLYGPDSTAWLKAASYLMRAAPLLQRILSLAASDSGSARKSWRFLFIEKTPGLG